MDNMEQSRGVGLRDFIAQGTACEGLVKTLEDGRFVHAYLITGQEGVGKRTLAREIAKKIEETTAPEDEIAYFM